MASPFGIFVNISPAACFIPEKLTKIITRILSKKCLDVIGYYSKHKTKTKT